MMCETWVCSLRFFKGLTVVILGLLYVELNYEQKLHDKSYS
jgi:hypothetical protein